MIIRLKKLVELFGGQLKGDEQIVVTNIAPLEFATTSDITFLSNPKFRLQAENTQAAALILTSADNVAIIKYRGTRIITENPNVYFAKIAQLFAMQKQILLPYGSGIHTTACIAADANIATTASIGPYVVIESGAVIGERGIIDAGSFIGHHARVGADTHFYARVTFHAACEIGKRGIVHSGAVIGSDGFGFAKEENDTWIKIPQIGRVIIGDDVEIGANTTIDRGTMADTIIENGVKLDNQIQIAHNCIIGGHTAIAACTGIAGSTKIGKFCSIGGAAMIHNHIKIADKVNISAGTFVSHSIIESGKYTGFYPMAKHADWEKSAVLVRNLRAIREKIRTLEKMIKLLIKRKQ